MTERLEALLGEIDRAAESVRGTIIGFERILTLGTVVIGGIASVGVKTANSALLWAVLPLPTFVVAIYGLSLLLELRSQGGYRAGLEQEVNGILQQDTLLYESRVAPATGHRGLPNVVLPVLYLIILIVVTLAGWRHAGEVWKTGTSADWYRFGLLAVGVLTLAASVAAHNGYEVSRRIARGGHPAYAGASGVIRRLMLLPTWPSDETSPR